MASNLQDKIAKARAAGYSDDEIASYLQTSMSQQPAAPAQTSRASDIRGSALGGVAMGLRDPVDALAQVARRVVPESVGRAVDRAGNYLADLGLPVARSTGVEGVDKIVNRANQEYETARANAGREGFDVARIGGNILNPVNRLVPLPGGLSTAANIGRSTAQGAITSLATPVLNDGDFWSTKGSQLLLSALTAPAAAYAGDKALKAADRGIGAVKRAVTPANVTTSANMQRVESALQDAATQGGFDLADIPASILDKARRQGIEALQGGRNMDMRAVLRQAEAEQILGQNARLMTGQATRDPMLFAKELDLRGVRGAGEGIANRLSAQNTGLINALNTRGASAAPGEMAAGQGLIGSLQSADEAARRNITGLYNQAKSFNANEIPLDSFNFADAALKNLDKEMKLAFLPPQITDIVNKVSKGDIPLNISTSEQIKSTLAEAGRTAKRAGDGNTERAIGIVRDALEDVKPAVQLGQEAQTAFNAARKAARDRFTAIESNPAMKAAIDDMAPDKFFNKFVLSAPARDVKKMLDAAPDQADAVRAQVVDYLKSKALSGAEDEVGRFSQSGYNKALKSIGETKLRQLFPAEEVAQLKSIGNVASYIQAQPAGSAVNNSNTGAAVMNLLSNLSGRVGRLPGINLARDSVQQFSDERAVANALSGNIPSTAVPNSADFLRSRLSPILGSGGLLGAYMAQ